MALSFGVAALAAGCTVSDSAGDAGADGSAISHGQDAEATDARAESSADASIDGGSDAANDGPIDAVAWDASIDASGDLGDAESDAADEAAQDATLDVVFDAAPDAADDASSDAGVDSGAYALGAIGQPCSAVGYLACADHATKQQVVCWTDLTWDGNGACAAGTLCDSRPGPEQGTCASIRCASTAQPGDVYCSGLTRTLCGPDRVSTSAVETCVNQACTPAACVGVCAPGQKRCSGSFDVETCDATGQWAVSSTCTGDSLCSAGACVACTYGKKLCGGDVCLDLSANPLHCGACARDCQAGTCTAGLCTPTVLLDDSTLPTWLAADGSSVYWSAKRHYKLLTGTTGYYLPATLKRYPLPQGPAVTLFSSVDVDVSTFAVDAQTAYFFTTSGGSVGALMAVPLDGSAPATTLAAGLPTRQRVVLTDTEVYWSEYTSATSTFTIRKVAKIGGAPVTVATGAVMLSLANSTTADVYWWTKDAAATASLYRLASGGAAPALVASGLPYVADVAVNATHAYWLSTGDPAPALFPVGSLMKASLAGGPFETIATRLDYPSFPLLIDDRTAYWLKANGGPAAIVRTALDGSQPSPMVLATGYWGPCDLAHDTTNVYWSFVHDWDATPLGGSVQAVMK